MESYIDNYFKKSCFKRPRKTHLFSERNQTCYAFVLPAFLMNKQFMIKIMKKLKTFRSSELS